MDRRQEVALERATRAIKEATRRQVEQHRRLGLPIAVERDGAVVWLGPDEIEVPAPEGPGGAVWRPVLFRGARARPLAVQLEGGTVRSGPVAHRFRMLLGDHGRRGRPDAEALAEPTGRGCSPGGRGISPVDSLIFGEEHPQARFSARSRVDARRTPGRRPHRASAPEPPDCGSNGTSGTRPHGLPFRLG